jgi:hypothetical protein
VHAVRYSSGKVVPVRLPPWVSVGAVQLANCATPYAECLRCGLKESLEFLTRPEAERQLGTFADWHRKCRDRSQQVVAPRVSERDLGLVSFVRKR